MCECSLDTPAHMYVCVCVCVRALPDGFQQPVVADVGLLRLLGASGSDAGPGRACADLLAAISVRCVLQKDMVVRQFQRHVQSWILNGSVLPALMASQKAVRSLILSHS